MPYPLSAVRNKNFGITTPSPLLNQLIAFWPGDEASGARLDAHINAFHMTAHNGVGNTDLYPAVYPTMRRYVQTSSMQWHSIADNPLLAFTSDQAFTIIFWCLSFEGDNPSGGYKSVFGKGTSAQTYAEKTSLWAQLTGDDALHFYVGNGTAYADLQFVGGPNNQQYGKALFIGWHDPDANYVGLSRNNCDRLLSWSTGTYFSTSNFNIGKIWDGQSSEWGGPIGPVAFWKRTLSAAERSWLWNTGTGRTYSALSSCPVLPSGIYRTNNYNFIADGDSKTVEANLGTGSWPTRLQESLTNDLYNGEEFLPNQAHGGFTIYDPNGISGLNNVIDADLAARPVGQTPAYILMNIGCNDTYPGTFDPANEAATKAALLYIIDAYHTKYPSAKIYVSRVWRRVGEANAPTVNSWINYCIGQRSGIAYAGPDESVWLENGDDGTTYTDDGTHYNALGKVKAAQMWRAALGI